MVYCCDICPHCKDERFNMFWVQMKFLFSEITIFALFLWLTAPLSKPCLFSVEKSRVFRPDKSYAVTMGKWYFEFEVLTAGNMRVGWARPGCTPDKELGSDDQAYVFDGFEVRHSNFTTSDISKDSRCCGN